MHTPAYTAGLRLGKSAALLATLLPLRRQAKPKPPEVAVPTIVGYYNVLDRPVQLVRAPDGSQTAIDRAERVDMPVPVEWVLAFGKSVSWPEYVGLVTARRLALKAPKVLVAPDGHEALIVTPKTTCSRRHWKDARWRTGTHFSIGELRAMRHVDGTRAQAIIRDSQGRRDESAAERAMEVLMPAIVAGMRRHTAAMALDDDGMPLLVGEVSDDEMLDLPLMPVVEAAALARAAIAKAAAQFRKEGSHVQTSRKGQ